MKKLLISLIALVGLSVSGLAFANGLGLGLCSDHSPHNFADDWCGGAGGAVCDEITGAGTPRSIDSLTVQRPSPESST